MTRRIPLLLFFLSFSTPALAQDEPIPEIPAWREISITQSGVRLQLGGFTLEEIRTLFELRALTLQFRTELQLSRSAVERSTGLVRALERQVEAQQAQRQLDVTRMSNLEAQLDEALEQRAQAERRQGRGRILPWTLTVVSVATCLVLGTVVVAR